MERTCWMKDRTEEDNCFFFCVVDCSGLCNSKILPAFWVRMFTKVLFYLGFMSVILCLCLLHSAFKYMADWHCLLLYLKLIQHFWFLYNYYSTYKVKLHWYSSNILVSVNYRISLKLLFFSNKHLQLIQSELLDANYS